MYYVMNIRLCNESFSDEFVGRLLQGIKAQQRTINCRP